MLKSSAKLNEMEMDNVVGGTRAELADLIDTISISGALGSIAQCGAYVPGANSTAKKLVSTILEGMGIDANINLGWGDTGIREKANTYYCRASGKSMTHGQVLDAIKHYKSRNNLPDLF